MANEPMEPSGLPITSGIAGKSAVNGSRSIYWFVGDSSSMKLLAFISGWRTRVSSLSNHNMAPIAIKSHFSVSF
jgi:hypothetical protein